ncbi:MAG: hypothetical protein HQK83_08255 [Fibrobacteria bacterium]|nr:hypothetical protein [Fibrobacteria bacterium]
MKNHCKQFSPHTKTISYLLCLLFIFAVSTSKASDDVKFKPLSIAGLWEAGQIRSGIVGGSNTNRLRKEWMDHFGAFMYQEATYKERLTIALGLGGIFQFPKQESLDKGIFGSQWKAFYVGPSSAKGTYSFGDVDSPFLKLSLGMFPFKYNTDAPNLGEYLFRCGPYPTYIMSGGFATIDNATAYIQGMHAEFTFGNLKLDALITTETALPPLYDFSLSGLAAYTIADGFLTIGAGVMFKNLISVDEVKTTPKNNDNAYFYTDGNYYPVNDNYYNSERRYWETNYMLDTNLYDPADTVQVNAVQAEIQIIDDQQDLVWDLLDKKDSLEKYIDTVTLGTSKNTAINTLNSLPEFQYYTSGGMIFMGRFSFDIKKLFDQDLFGDNDLKLYGEVALLGWKDYPVFYENKKDRIPFMIGFNLPGFKFFDLISFQYELFKSPYANSFFNLPERKYIPTLPEGGDKAYSEKSYNDLTNDDNHYWSLLVQKTIYPGLTLSVQAARDHLRTVSTDVYFGARLEPSEVLSSKNNWYLMAQLAWSM